jgi:hypothetical protein
LLIKDNGLGHERTGASIAVVTGIFKLLAAVSRSPGTVLTLVYYKLSSFAGMVTLTLYTVEVVPTAVRSFCPGIMMFGLVAFIITTVTSAVAFSGGSVWFCGAIWIVMADIWFALPVETQATAVLRR